MQVHYRRTLIFLDAGSVARSWSRVDIALNGCSRRFSLLWAAGVRGRVGWAMFPLRLTSGKYRGRLLALSAPCSVSRQPNGRPSLLLV